MSASKNLTQEIATVAKDLTYPAFGGIMRSSDEVLALKGGGKGLAIYDDLERDPWVYACLHKRKMAVIGRPWIVEPASESRLDKKAADMVRAHLTALDFDAACYHLLDAILKGRAVGEIMWVRDGNELRPAEIRPKNARRFTFDEHSALRLLTVSNTLIGEEVPDRKFIVHSVGAKDGNPHGLGLGQKLWWPVFFKRQGLSFWLQFLDKFGAPTAVGTYQAGVDIGQLEVALARIAHDAGVALPEGTSVKLLEATRGGTVTHEGLCRYMDEQIAAAVLGEGGSKGGGGEMASAAILRNELRLELVQADADLQSGTLNASVIAWDVELNLPGARPPRVWREIKKEEDLKARAERDKLLFDMGFRPTLDYVRETYGGQWELAPDKTKPPAPKLPAEFAQGDEVSVPDQAALDAALNEIPAAALQGQMEQLIGPLLASLEAAGGYEEAMVVLASAYPTLDAGKLERLLAQAMFAAELWGAAHADQ